MTPRRVSGGTGVGAMPTDGDSEEPMKVPDVRRWMAVAVVVIAVTIVVEAIWQGWIGLRPETTDAAALAVYFERFYNDMLVIVVIDTVLLTALIAFTACFRQLVAGRDPRLRWIADIWTGSNLVVVALTLAGDGMAGGAALNARTGADPVVIRALTEGHMMTFGAVACVPASLALIAAASLTWRTRVLPRWTGWFAIAAAFLNLAVVPMTFWDVSDASIFSPGGWVSVMLSVFPFLVWVCIVGSKLARASGSQP